MTSADPDPAHLHALVDMGSNGIRFSISNLSPATARIMPTIYQERAGISLYDAQYSNGDKVPISAETITDVVRAFTKFQRVCGDFAVPSPQIRVVATEASREAINSIELRDAIVRQTGWTVELLPKEEEGRIGAIGIASSFGEVAGLVLDLGGGSVQMGWVDTRAGEIDVGKPISLPYGAAALTRRLQHCGGDRSKLQALGAEVQAALKTTFDKVISSSEQQGRILHPFSAYLSGGGFRGWGHMLMDQHPLQPYPIPTINGFRVSADFFNDIATVEARISATRTPAASEEDKIFRVSDRRGDQVPAIAFLVSALKVAVPKSLQSIQFAQGGVREGLLFSSLPSVIRAQRPWNAATCSFAPFSRSELLALMTSATHTAVFPAILLDLLEPFTNLMYAHRSLQKDARAAAAVRCTTTGILGHVHGVDHAQRAMLAIMLCERWGGELAPTDEDFYERLQGLVINDQRWLARYLGRVGALVAAVYPSGRIPGFPRLALSAENTDTMTLRLNITWHEGRGEFGKEVRAIEKLGRKKTRVSGRNAGTEGSLMEIRLEIPEKDGCIP